MTGANSTFESTFLLNIGGAGTGILSLENGGRATSGVGGLAGSPGGTGTANVTGTNSQWDVTSSLIVGGTIPLFSNDPVAGGTGTLNINAGGRVAVGDVAGASTSGSLVVSDMDSDATGVAVFAGGQIANTTGDTVLGDAAGEFGSITLSGAGATLINNADSNFFMTVGNSGTGTLNIEDGGAASSSVGVIGRISGSTGTATVSGIGSTWTNNDRLSVASQGAGTLNVEDGGVVSNTNGTLGFGSGATGAATVTGSGSTWINSGDLTVGVSGAGTLSITDGGAVSNVRGFVANSSGSTGMATVTGIGSTWTNSNELVVGLQGAGTLNVADGGAVSNVRGLLAMKLARPAWRR